VAIIDAIRYGEDFANAANCVIGECPYSVYLVSSVGEAISVDTLFNPVPIPTSNRITIADGYRSYLVYGNSSSDGYLNPIVKEFDSNVLLASGESFTEKLVSIGPICLPYSLNWIDGNVFNGGISPEVFSPPIGSFNNNISYWILIVGPGITGGNGKGSYYSIESIQLAVGDSGIAGDVCYYVIVKTTGFSPPGTT
jgi:hypothetical protein